MGMIINPYRFTNKEPEVIDFCSEENYNTGSNVYAGSNITSGQSFTSVNNYKITTCKFYIVKSGSPTGNIYAKVWDHTGTYGTSSKPTGSYLAISDVINIETISTSINLVTFTFSGANQIIISSKNYCVNVISNNGNSSNYLRIGSNSSAGTHGGNRFYSTDETSWSSFAQDVIFYIYGIKQ
jgi:hypothetical protein